MVTVWSGLYIQYTSLDVILFAMHTDSIVVCESSPRVFSFVLYFWVHFTLNWNRKFLSNFYSGTVSPCPNLDFIRSCLITVLFFKKKNYLYTALARWSSAHACKEASCHLSDYGQIQEVLAKKICVSAAWCLPVSGSACPVTFRGVNTIARG